jgi:hypothetical protein
MAVSERCLISVARLLAWSLFVLLTCELVAARQSSLGYQRRALIGRTLRTIPKSISNDGDWPKLGVGDHAQRRKRDLGSARGTSSAPALAGAARRTEAQLKWLNQCFWQHRTIMRSDALRMAPMDSARQSVPATRNLLQGAPLQRHRLPGHRLMYPT